MKATRKLPGRERQFGRLFPGDAIDADRRTVAEERVGRAGGEGGDNGGERAAERRDLRHQRRAVGDLDDLFAVGDKVDRAGGGDDAALAARQRDRRSAGGFVPCALSTPLGAAASSCSPTMRAQAMISEALPRTIVGFSASRRRSSRRGSASRRRRPDRAPKAFRSSRDSAAASMPTTQSVDSVPMLTTSALAIAPKSSASSGAWTIAGEAPIASSALAATSIET